MGDKSLQEDSKAAISPRAVIVFAIYALGLPAVVFLAAGTTHWPMGWVYYGLAAGLTLLSRALVALAHPDLLAERGASMEAENAKDWDRPLSLLVGLLMPLIVSIVVGLDKRWGWTAPLPGWVAPAALGFLLAGYTIATWALVANRFFSGVVRIQSDRGHHVVRGGPYHFVRHPGYAGALLAAFATPLMLNSYWGLIPAGLYVILIVVRTALEDRALHEELPGYRDYAQETRYRLLPGVW